MSVWAWVVVAFLDVAVALGAVLVWGDAKLEMTRRERWLAGLCVWALFTGVLLMLGHGFSLPENRW